METLSKLDCVQSYKNEIISILKQKLNRNGVGCTLLEVGCGLGSLSAQLANLVGTAGKVIGLDISAQFIQYARKRYPDLVEFVEGDVMKLDQLFESNSFDGVVIDRVLQHLIHPDEALHQVMRVLKDGGILVCVEPDWKTLQFLSGCEKDSIELDPKVSNWYAQNIRNPRIGIFSEMD